MLKLSNCLYFWHKHASIILAQYIVPYSQKWSCYWNLIWKCSLYAFSIVILPVPHLNKSISESDTMQNWCISHSYWTSSKDFAGDVHRKSELVTKPRPPSDKSLIFFCGVDRGGMIHISAPFSSCLKKDLLRQFQTLRYQKHIHGKAEAWSSCYPKSTLSWQSLTLIMAWCLWTSE